MKLRKVLLGIAPILITTASFTTTLASCSKTIGKMPKIKYHNVHNALLNVLAQNTSTGELFYVTSDVGPIEVHHFNGSTIGYINVDDYVNTLMQFEYIYGPDTANYNSVTKDYKTVITNTNNNATATIDYKEQTITFSDYDMFGCEEKAYAKNPLAVGAGGGEAYYHKTGGSVLATSTYESGGQYVIDLTKYNIIAYSEGDKGYLPYDVYRNILNRNPVRTMFYNGVNFYQVSASNSTATTNLYKQIRDEATIINSDYMEYCYNLLALTLDHKFGLTERPGRAPENKGKTIKYFPNGAYEKLAPYKEGLTSLDPDIANDAMCQFFQYEVDDGGHAGYSGLDILSTRPHKSVKGYEKANTFEARDKITQAREDISATDPVAPDDYWYATSPTIYSTYNPDNYIKLYGEGQSKPILYITFDSFKAVDRYTTDEMAVGHVKYNNVTANNYFLDTIRMTMYADKYIKNYNSTHTGDDAIKNVVLDISNNGGGTVYTEHFLASWLCGGVDETIWNPHSKSFSRYRIEADVNGDGVFDANDYLSSDTNVYCITSEMSFSCGNMLPCNLVDNRTTNTYFIGCPSGGGACFVDGDMHIGLGNVFRSSSNYHMLKKNSTKSKPITVESGNQPQTWFYPIACTWAECSKFVDRATINTKIRG